MPQSRSGTICGAKWRRSAISAPHNIFSENRCSAIIWRTDWPPSDCPGLMKTRARKGRQILKDLDQLNDGSGAIAIDYHRAELVAFFHCQVRLLRLGK